MGAKDKAQPEVVLGILTLKREQNQTTGQRAGGVRPAVYQEQIDIKTIAYGLHHHSQIKLPYD